MDGDVIDIFSGLVMEDAAARTELPSKPRRPYKMYEAGDEAQFNLRVHNAVGGVMLISYVYQSQMLLMPGHRQLDLIFHNINSGVVTVFWGTGLEDLVEPLQGRKIRAIHCFNEREYFTPAEGEPIITSMRLISLKSYREWMAKKKQQREECR